MNLPYLLTAKPTVVGFLFMPKYLSSIISLGNIFLRETTDGMSGCLLQSTGIVPQPEALYLLEYVSKLDIP